MKKCWFPVKIFILIIVVLGCVVISVSAQQTAASPQAFSPESFIDQITSARHLLEGNPLKKKIVETIFIVLFGYLVMFGFIGIINKRVKDIKTRHIVRKNVIYIVTIVLIVVAFFIWIQDINSITIFLGVAGAGLALALQEVILCVAGWLLILIRHPYETGDRIEINGIKGDVIDIRLFQTSLLEIGNWVNADQSTGRIVNFPNSFVYKYANYNYSRGFEFIWHEIPILVTFESDWKRGKEIIMVHAQKMAEGMEEKVNRKIDVMRNRYMIYYGKLTPIVYVSIKDSGIELTLRYLTEAKMRRDTQDALCQAILDDLEKEPNVNLAYPTYRIVKN